jgi:hypothetical protein
LRPRDVSRWAGVRRYRSGINFERFSLRRCPADIDPASKATARRRTDAGQASAGRRIAEFDTAAVSAAATLSA